MPLKKRSPRPPLKRYLYRCTRKNTCGTRLTLKQPLEWYARKKRCPGCGQDTLKLDRWQMIHRRILCRCNSTPHTFAEEGCFFHRPGERHDHAEQTCDCGHELHYPHRYGSKGCVHYPHPLTDEEMYERYGVAPDEENHPEPFDEDDEVY